MRKSTRKYKHNLKILNLSIRVSLSQDILITLFSLIPFKNVAFCPIDTSFFPATNKNLSTPTHHNFNPNLSNLFSPGINLNSKN